MTMIRPRMLRCAVCEKESEQEVLLSTSSYGSDDMDERPNGIERASIGFFIQRCPHCGYVSSSIDEQPARPITSEWLSNHSYLTCDGIKFSSELAASFFRRYLIHINCCDKKSALIAIRYAVWACDDSREKDNASRCREIAADIAFDFYTATMNSRYLLLWSDFMRRSGHFEEVIKYIDNQHNNDVIRNNVLIAFERKHAAMHDDDSYTIEEALEEMKNNRFTV